MPGSSTLGIVFGTATAERTRIETRKTSDMELAAASRAPFAPRGSAAGQEVPKTLLLRWNAAMFLFHSVLATVTLTVGNLDLTVPTYKTILTFTIRNITDPDQGWDLVPALEEAESLPFTILAASFFLLSAFFHLLNFTLLRGYYLRQLADCYTPTRWVEYTFSASVMQLLIAYTLGIRERFSLYAAAVLVGVTMPFGYWGEQAARPASPDAWTKSLAYRLLPWVVGHVPQVASWAIVVAQLYDGQFDFDRVPWFVFLILWGELALFFSFGFVQLGTQCMPPRLFWRGELAFQVLSLVAKGLLGLVLIFNVLMLSQFDDLYGDE